MAITKFVNGGTIAGKDGETLTRCYGCEQPYLELSQLDTKRNGKLGAESEATRRTGSLSMILSDSVKAAFSITTSETWNSVVSTTLLMMTFVLM